MIHRKSFFDQQIKIDLRIYNNIRKVATDHMGDYATVCLLYYLFFQKNHKLIVINLSNQQTLDADLKAIQQIDFTGNLDRDEAKEAKKTLFFIFLKEL